MQTKPTTWPEPGGVERLPELFLSMPGSQWPPASESTTAGVAEVGQWSIQRQLTGGMLPGQVRGASGFSVASGEVQIRQVGPAVLSPWGRAGARLSPGGTCTVYASHGGPDAFTRIRLGEFMVAPIRGSNTRGDLSLELDDHAVRLTKRVTLNWTYDDAATTFDTSWVLSEVARLNGYQSVPSRSGTGVELAAPLCGWEHAEVGQLTYSEAAAWENSDGMVGLGPEAFLHYRGTGAGSRTGMHFSCMVSGRGGMINRGGITVDVRPTAAYFRMGATHFATAAFPDDGKKVRLVKISYLRTGPQLVRIWYALPGQTLQYVGEFQLPTEPGQWRKEDTITVATNASNGGGGTPTRWVKGLCVYERQDFSFPEFTPKARIEYANSPLSGVFGVKNQGSWDLLQQVASATAGAVWLTEDGTLTYRGRESLRGALQYVETVEALDSVESLDWVIDPSDVADRVELSYTPTTVIKSSTDAITLWESTDLIRVAAGATNTIIAQIEGTTDRVAGFLPLWSETYPSNTKSRWAASTLRDGSGERPANDALTVTGHIDAPGRVRITIKNNTDHTLWVVDGNGDPCLILRTGVHIMAGETETIGNGMGPDTAVNVLELDAGPWVQDPQAAQQILSWTAGQTSNAQALVEQARVKPDLARQIGDIIRLKDGHTGLLSKALITGISLDGDSTGYSQRLDLALLGLTFSDFTELMLTYQVTTFAQLDEFLQANQLNTFTAFDEWGQDFGGKL